MTVVWVRIVVWQKSFSIDTLFTSQYYSALYISCANSVALYVESQDSL